MKSIFENYPTAFSVLLSCCKKTVEQSFRERKIAAGTIKDMVGTSPIFAHCKGHCRRGMLSRAHVLLGQVMVYFIRHVVFFIPLSSTVVSYHF